MIPVCSVHKSHLMIGAGGCNRDNSPEDVSPAEEEEGPANNGSVSGT